jgi:hypothetical protein
MFRSRSCVRDDRRPCRDRLIGVRPLGELAKSNRERPQLVMTCRENGNFSKMPPNLRHNRLAAHDLSRGRIYAQTSRLLIGRGRIGRHRLRRRRINIVIEFADAIDARSS